MAVKICWDTKFTKPGFKEQSFSEISESGRSRHGKKKLPVNKQF